MLDRNCFAAIVYMARTSTPWRLLPARELGCGSPTTCWRRLTEWARAGVFDALHLAVLDRLGEQGRLDWSRASVDTTSVRAKRGGPCGRKSGRSWQAWEQAPPGLRRERLPLTPVVTAANAGDTIMFQALLDDVPAVLTPSGRRRTRPTRSPVTRRTTARPTAPTCVAAGSSRGSPGVGSTPQRARASSLEGGTVAVLVELLAAPAGALGPGLGAVVRVRAGGLCGRVSQQA
jgi:transposase